MVLDVDLISANYNNSEYLEDFFDSLLSSSDMPARIIFVDDGSTDDSLLVAKKYECQLPGLQLICLPKNVGFANALNEGLRASSAKYIMRLDPDDLIHPDRIRKQYEFLERNPGVAVVGTQAEYFHSATKQYLGSTNMPVGQELISAAYLRCDNGVLHGTTMFRRSCIEDIVYRQKDVPSEDYSFFGRIMARGYNFHNIDQELIKVRVHSKSVSNDIRFSTIEKVHILRQEIFGIPKRNLFLLADFISMRFYRKYLYERSLLLRLLYVSIAALFAPQKAVSRVFGK